MPSVCYYKLFQTNILTTKFIKGLYFIISCPPPATDSGRTARTLLYPPVQAVYPYSLPSFFFLSRTEEPAKSGTCAHDRRALHQFALNVHVKHWPDLFLAQNTTVVFVISLMFDVLQLKLWIIPYTKKNIAHFCIM